MVAIEAFELFVSPTTCLKFPALNAGTSPSQRLRLRMVSRVRYTYRSMAIDTPTTKIKASGYRNRPPSLKKLTAEFMKFICALLIDSSVLICNSTRFRKIGYDLLLTLLRRAAWRTILGRIGLHSLVINHFAFENVPIDRCQDLVNQAIHGFSGQVANIRLLPGDDVHDLRLLAVAGHGSRTQFQPVGGARSLLLLAGLPRRTGGGGRRFRGIGARLAGLGLGAGRPGSIGARFAGLGLGGGFGGLCRCRRRRRWIARGRGGRGLLCVGLQGQTEQAQTQRFRYCVH